MMSQDGFIRDNHKYGIVGEYLQQHIKPNSQLSVVSAFFTIYAYQQLKEKLDSIDHLRFLFGEPTFIKSIDPEKSNVRAYEIEDSKLSIPLENRLTQKRTAKECAEWIQEKVEIRSMVKPNFLHGKMYHITQESGIENAIVGSSNFTVNGLGLGGNNNIELNITIDSDSLRRDLKKWFDSLWEDQTGLVEDVKAEVLKYLEQVYRENDPEFVYYKTLFHIFEQFLDEHKKGGLLDEKTGFFDSEIWNALYDFQKDGTKGAINKILKHNGCIIADSVGLGKTFEALAVIKYFELLNQRVLVVCPKKLRGNWTIYQANQNNSLNPFPKDRFGYTVIYHTDLTREKGMSDANGINLETFNWANYDLIVIDESHNFKGNPREKAGKDGKSKINRAKWLLDKMVKEGVKSKILMLSATPVNNNLKDLRNQIAYITEDNDGALFECCQIKNISQTLNTAQNQFTRWADPKNKDRSTKDLLERLDSAFFKLLDELTIARSRKHIKSNYNLKKIGSFPERLKPKSVYTEIDLMKRFPNYDAINEQISKYKLAIFNPSEYVKPEFHQKYENLAQTKHVQFKQSKREYFLIDMMKVNFLKRLESSIKSFEISMDRTIRKIEMLEERIQQFLTYQTESKIELTESLNQENESPEDMDEKLEEWLVGKKFTFDMADMNVELWLADLSKDKDALNTLYNTALAVGSNRDAKLDELKKIIRCKVNTPINADNKKVIVFTAFADTAEYLYDNLKEWCQKTLQQHIALVCGSFTKTSYGKNDYDSILTNFSPISKNREKLTQMDKDQEIEILIATDCISEGQNLQDCDYLINYDIHWNPVRILQRFGRIDRLGSKNSRIQLVNFWPTKDLNKYINLKERVEARMALVDVTATGEENVLNSEQIEDLISEDLKYRNKQLKRLQKEVLDLEEIPDGISLTDFSLDDFRIELLNFLEGNNQKLQNTPFGLYANVPAPTDEKKREIIKPGVIFCLKHKDAYEGNDVVNPLNPYYLVYIRDDGTVRYNFLSAKRTLEIFRLLCQGQKAPYESLCDLFNQETKQGKKMDHYINLLKKSVEEIAHVFKKKQDSSLLNNRSFKIVPPSRQIKNMDNFELVTWLVIQGEQQEI
jgi:ERCC4-related helicase